MVYDSLSQLKRIQNKDNSQTFNPATDSLEAVSEAITVHSGTTTSDGAGGGTSLIDSALIGSNDYLTGKSILLTSGICIHETKPVSSFNPATGEVTFGLAFSAQILTGVTYEVMVSAGSGGVGSDQWLTPLPGAYGAGTAGEIVGDNLDVAISTRASPGDQMTLTPAEETAIQGKILTDATPFPGADIDTAISTRATPSDVTGAAAATDALISVHSGTTTSDGNIGGATLIDSALIGSNDYLTGKSVLITSGGCNHETKTVQSFNAGTGELTFTAAYTAQIVTGVTYEVMVSAASGGGSGSPVPKLYVGDLTISADTTDANDAVITGNLTVQAGFTYVVTGNLQVFGDTTNQGRIIALNADFGGNVDNTGASNGIDIAGDCHISEDLTNDTASTNISGKLFVGGNLDNTSTGNLYTGDDCHVAGTLNNGVSTVTVEGHLFADTINQVDVTNVGSITVYGGCSTGNGQIAVNGGTVNIFGNCITSGVSVSAAGNFYVNGHLENTYSMDLTGGGYIGIQGDCQVASDFTNDVCNTTITGKLTVAGNLTTAVTGIITAGPVTVNGDINNAGTLTSNGGIQYVGTYTNTGTVNNNMYKTP